MKLFDVLHYNPITSARAHDAEDLAKLLAPLGAHTDWNGLGDRYDIWVRLDGVGFGQLAEFLVDHKIGVASADVHSGFWDDQSYDVQLAGHQVAIKGFRRSALLLGSLA